VCLYIYSHRYLGIPSFSILNKISIKHSRTSLHGNRCSFLLGKSAGVDLFEHMVSNCQIVFQNGSTILDL
jgi:hypothetical protein